MPLPYLEELSPVLKGGLEPFNDKIFPLEILLSNTEYLLNLA